MELWQAIEEELKMLDAAVKALRPRGEKKALTEHAYRVALSKRLLELRAAGQPVTHLLEIAKGEVEIAMLRLERDIAEALYESAQEAINVQKLKIRVLENQLSREWGAVK